MHKHRFFSYFMAICCLVVAGSWQFGDAYNDAYGIYEKSETVEQQLANMSLEEKIGQLFMLPVYSERSEFHRKEIESAIRKYKIGGLIFMKGHPSVQAKWTNRFQQISETPLFVAMDAEWGLSMRLDSVVQYQKAMTLGALQDDSLVYDFGKTIGEQLRLLGVNISFAPVADINSNPENPVIHMRSFGENKYDVARKSYAYMRGLQDSRVLAVAKHFPGHGDTELDSHKDLPVLTFSKRRLRRVELYPFKKLFQMGVGGVMSAHLKVEAFQKEEKVPASLSRRMTHRLLRREMDFEGICFSDALNMKGVANVKEENIDLTAFLAGNDVLLFPRSIENSIQKIKAAIASGRISEKQLDRSVMRILQAKKWLTIDRDQKDSSYYSSLINNLNKGSYKSVAQDISEKSLVLLKNKNDLLPFRQIKELKLVNIGLDTGSKTPFNQLLSLNRPTTEYFIPLNSNAAFYEKKLEELNGRDSLIICLYSINPYRVQRNFGYDSLAIDFIRKLSSTPRSVLISFGSPYFLEKCGLKANSIIQAFEKLQYQQYAAAELLLGSISAKGQLPVSINQDYSFGYGMRSANLQRMRVGFPEQEGLHSDSLARIDSIAHEAISIEASPGCQVLVARNGRVIFHQAYGYHTYDSIRPVELTDLYDLASITKVASSTFNLMDLYQKGLLDVDQTLSYYLDTLVDSTKSELILREILAHQSGLRAWIPFYRYTLTTEGFCDSNYCYMPNNYYRLQVADSLFIQYSYTDSILHLINQSPLGTRGEYRYSDLGYFYMQQIIEKIGGEPLYNRSHRFYRQLGLSRMGYLPLSRFDKSEIVPTENDFYFRRQLIHGYVHDPAAAMMGGVAGHAGLFSNAYDLGILMQMMLNRGVYGGKQFLEGAVIDTFTKKQYEGNRKGMGFDKPELRPGKVGPAIKDMSASSFGHTGFTGTCTWVDPEHQLVYVFLSNRVYPSADNKKLIRKNIRTRILQVIYNDLLQKQEDASH